MINDLIGKREFYLMFGAGIVFSVGLLTQLSINYALVMLISIIFLSVSLYNLGKIKSNVSKTEMN